MLDFLSGCSGASIRSPDKASLFQILRFKPDAGNLATMTKADWMHGVWSWHKHRLPRRHVNPAKLIFSNCVTGQCNMLSTLFYIHCGLPSVTVTDRRERTPSLSYPDSMISFVPVIPGHHLPSHDQDSYLWTFLSHHLGAQHIQNRVRNHITKLAKDASLWHAHIFNHHAKLEKLRACSWHWPYSSRTRLQKLNSHTKDVSSTFMINGTCLEISWWAEL